ncbi:hypothetical protein ACRRTK_016010 [Alexandromys fortis]
MTGVLSALLPARAARTRSKRACRAPAPPPGGVCVRHMGRPPPIGSRRLTRPRADRRAARAEPLKDTPPSGARGRSIG